MKVTRIPVGQMQSNCYLVVDKSDSELLIIDPGDDYEYIIDKVTLSGVRPIGIVATHGHFDHIMGVTALQLTYGIPFYAHPHDRSLIDRMDETARYFIGEIHVGPPPKITHELIDSGVVRFGSESLTVIETPGHTTGGICLYSPGSMFVGDVLFAGGSIGRTDFSYSNTADLLQSIQKIVSYPGDTILYPGHGEETRIDIERRYH